MTPSVIPRLPPRPGLSNQSSPASPLCPTIVSPD